MNTLFVKVVAWLSGLTGLLQKLYDEWLGIPARYWRQRLAEEKRKGEEAVEQERLEATYARIAKEERKRGQALVEYLNSRFRRRP